MVSALPSSATPTNRPRLREYEYTSAENVGLVPAEAARPTGPAATEASAPSVNWPLAMRSMLRLVVNTRMTSVDCTPHWKPKLPPVRLTNTGSLKWPLGSRATSTPLPRRPPKRLRMRGILTLNCAKLTPAGQTVGHTFQ